LVTRGTIEEKVYKKQVFKTLLSNQILENPRQQRLFSRSHLKELFEFNPDDDTGDDLALDTELPDSGVVLKHEAQQHARAYVASSSCASSTSNGRTAPSDGSESLVLAALFSGDNVTGVFRHDVLGSEETADRYARMSLRYAEGAAREQVAAALQRLQESAETASARTRTVAPHSSQLLNALRQRQQGSETQGIAGVDGHVERMARRIVEALSSGPVETERLIGMFPGVKDDAAYLFRDILHKVSVLKNHKWYLLKTFKTKQVPRE
jgi:DNA excision repair protein ERCC-6